MEQIVKHLRTAYDTSNKNEANIRFHVVIDCFLKNYGYNLSKCILEDYTGEGFCDIWYELEGGNGIPIEVKRGDKNINISDIRQTKKYADYKGVTFGILSNGYEFVLLDFTLKSVLHDEDDVARAYVVFWFNIFRVKDENFTELRYFKYMQYENIVVNQITRYFSDIAQYRLWKLDSTDITKRSWRGYKSTLFTFFELFGMKKGKYDLRYYEQIGMDDFKEYIQKCKYKGNDTSKKTVENNYTHLSNFLEEMQKHKKIRYFNLDEGRKRNLSEYMPTPPKKIITEIRADDINTALEYFGTTRNATRNIAIFLLSISIGIERAQLNKLK